MRTFSILILFLFAFKNDATGTELKTTITDVTVFQSGAQVYRSGSVKIRAGESEIKISDATSLIKKGSIQVKGKGDFTILSVNQQTQLIDVENKKTSWTKLETKQEAMMKEMQALSVKIQILKSREITIMNLKKISTTTKGVNVEQIEKAQELVRLKLTEIKIEKLKNSRLIVDLFDEYKTVSQHLLALKTPKKLVKHEIVVKVFAKTAVTGDFVINYLVPNARWYPTYDIRVKNVSAPMTIEYRANVSQESGEDWSNVNLKLSTGDPSQSSQKPKIMAWWLYLNQNYVQPAKRSNYYRYTDARFTSMNGTILNEKTGEAIPWCNVMVSGTNIGTTADANGHFSMVLPKNVKKLHVSSIGFTAKYVAISEKNLIVKLRKKHMALNKTVSTDYGNKLITVHSPTFNTDYTGVLSQLEVEVDEITLSAGEYALRLADADKSYSQNMYSEELSSMDGEVSAKRSVSKSIKALQVASSKKLNIVNTEFLIAEKYSIPSDPKNISVAIQTIQTDAQYQYYCAPRIDKAVFITAKLIDWEQYNLLEGQANVFFEETFIGNTFFDTRYLVDTLEISLGRDKGIKVDRKKSKDFNKHQSIGNDNVVSRHWDITVRNAKQQAIDIIVEDQFPVSSDSKLVVTQEEKSEGLLNEKTGIVSWQFTLAPSTTKKMQLKYKVKYPKGNFVGLD